MLTSPFYAKVCQMRTTYILSCAIAEGGIQKTPKLQICHRQLRGKNLTTHANPNRLSDMHLKAKTIVNKTPKNRVMEAIPTVELMPVDFGPSGVTKNKANKTLTLDQKASYIKGTTSKSLFNKFWICCKESRIESPNNFYGCFYLGPFDESLSQTLAHNIRRTLLSELSGLAITAVEIEGVLHKFSNLPGIQETVLDIICNLQNLVFKKSAVGGYNPACAHGDTVRTSQYQNAFKARKDFGSGQSALGKTQGFLRLRGPGVVKASDIILPSGIECVNPDQYIATLAEDGVLNMKIDINQGKNYIKQKQKNNFIATQHIATNNTNKIYLDSVFMPVTKVNTIVQNNNKCTDDVLENNLQFKLRKQPNLPETWGLGSQPKSSIEASADAFAAVSSFNASLDKGAVVGDSFSTSSAIPQFKSEHTQPFFRIKHAPPTAGSPENESFSELATESSAMGQKKDPSTGGLAPMSAADINDRKQNVLESFITLSDINKKQPSKQCHIIIEIWTNGSIHPREALYDCLGFLSSTFVTLENSKMLGSMFKSDMIYGQMLKKTTGA